MGHRSSDRRPPIADVVVIGHGYVVLAGCNECCVTHGPGLAPIAAELVTAGRTDTDISAYRVDRFADTGADATPFGIGLP